MQISVDNAQFQTIIFGIFFVFGLILSFRRRIAKPFFGKSKTEELKGFAILAIIFSHIGYFLVSDHSFLYPFSILAGVGVHLFLFLSGFGLTLSAFKNPLSVLGFYKKRLSNLFLPMWLVVILLISADFIILNRSYPGLIIVQAILGFFPYADIFKSLDSPLWYFSLIFFYYLIFPLLFWKRFAYFSPLFLWFTAYLILKKMNLPINPDVLNLYRQHFIAFPLGVLFAYMYTANNLDFVRQQLKKIFLTNYLKYILVIFVLLIFAYFSVNSGVGKDRNVEQITSTIVMFSAIFIFTVKSFEVRFLSLFGKYSYVIYLIHWPILSRYGFIYKLTPGSFATILYLLIFLILGWGLTKVLKGRKKHPSMI